MNIAASAPTNLPSIGLSAADVLPAEAAAMTPDQTLVARIGGSNGRFVRILRDDALGVLTGVVGMGTTTPVSFHMDRAVLATMLVASPPQDGGADSPLDDHSVTLVEQTAERLAVAVGVRWDAVSEPTGDEIVDRDTRGYWRLLARTALGL